MQIWLVDYEFETPPQSEGDVFSNRTLNWMGDHDISEL